MGHLIPAEEVRLFSSGRVCHDPRGRSTSQTNSNRPPVLITV